MKYISKKEEEESWDNLRDAFQEKESGRRKRY